MVRTPYYLLEESKLRKNLELISDVAERSGAEIILAFKAYSLWKTFHILREYIKATTASSVWEARLALEEFGERAHTYSPAYTEEDLPEILKCSSHLSFNSISQYRRFIPAVKEWNDSHSEEEQISCGLRINPEHSHIETDLYNPCAPGSRFGILANDLENLDKETALEGIEGFHCHCHCESSAEDLVDNLTYIEEKFGKWLPRLKWLNLGGGHLMTRKDYNVELLIETIRGLKSRYPDLHIILEPGSAFGWQTGPLVTSVVDIVQNKGVKTAIMDCSFTCHMPDSLEMPYWPNVRGAVTIEDDGTNTIEHIRELSDTLYIYRLGGNSCLSGDFMGLWQFDHELRVGEVLYLEDMNHYTMVKTTMFNGITHPSLVFKTISGDEKVLRIYSYNDYRDRMD